MPGWITTVLSGVAAFFGWRHAKAQADLREMDQDYGATQQREADKTETLKAKDAQLEKAVNRKPRAARKRLRDGS
ncbi:MAG: hypothetical protein GEU92_18975, partial [Alphaproteobacteria bacterium]|nr:hypothetical protein [Alphaproteobacteria bacterium]